jgi:hypothetical protein
VVEVVVMVPVVIVWAGVVVLTAALVAVRLLARARTGLGDCLPETARETSG